MTVLALIAKLTDLAKTHGDLEVWADNGEEYFYLTPVDAVTVGEAWPGPGELIVVLQNEKGKTQDRFYNDTL